MRILALDLAIVSGWCLVTPEGWRSGFLDIEPLLPRGNAELQNPFKAAEVLALVRGLIQEHKPDLVMVEEGQGRGIGSRILWGLIYIAQAAAADVGVATMRVPVPTWRKEIFGRGSVADNKATSVAFAQTKIPGVVDHNEADAVCIAEYARRKVKVYESLKPRKTALVGCKAA